MVPVAGSAYTYAYATLGELIAWIIGWDLILEYAIGSAAVANGWSNYFVELIAERVRPPARPPAALSPVGLRLSPGQVPRSRPSTLASGDDRPGLVQPARRGDHRWRSP